MDDATSTIYSAFLVEEEGTASTFAALLEVFTAQGLPCSLYTDRGSHYFHTDKAGGAVDKDHLTQVGRALAHLGIEHIPAYSPEARGRSERMFATLQDRLVKELEHAGIRDVATANAWLREVYLPQHNARFAKPAAVAEKAFVAADPVVLREALCVRTAWWDTTTRSPIRARSCSCRRAACAPTTSRRASSFANIRMAAWRCSMGRAASLAMMPPVTRSPPRPPQAWPRARRRQGVPGHGRVRGSVGAPASVDRGWTRGPARHAGRDQKRASRSNKETALRAAPAA